MSHDKTDPYIPNQNKMDNGLVTDMMNPVKKRKLKNLYSRKTLSTKSA
ncbi:hypothetical protein ACQKKK_07900 [Peribacillus sp. NPDC006672]